MAVRPGYARLLRVGVAALLFVPIAAGASRAEEWRPAAAERLVRMPLAALDRAIEQDFARSSLAAEIERSAEATAASSRSLGDLQDAIATADGDLRDRLRHQALVEKRHYVDAMERRLDLDGKRIETRIGLLERLLARLDRQEAGRSAADRALMADRDAAIARMEATREKVDLDLITRGAATTSRYAGAYREHAEAVRRLAKAIERHPMNQLPEIDGHALGKRAYLRHLLRRAEGERALLQQRRTVLTYMARLVALDALSLADEIARHQPEVAGVGDPEDLGRAVDAFID